MAANVIKAGGRIDLIRCNVGVNDNQVYKSQIYDVVGKEQLKIAMPQSRGKLLLLQLEAVYKMQFYTELGVYECKGKVVDRYKSDNVYVAVVDIVSSLKKIQRREFYRLDCLLDAQIHVLDEEEMKVEDIKELLLLYDEKRVKYEYATIVDISGGGGRLVTDCEVEEGSYITLKFKTELKGKVYEYEVLAKTITKRKLENKRRKYELRVEFEQLENNVRETLIKYIFEQERKKRKMEKS